MKVDLDKHLNDNEAEEEDKEPKKRNKWLIICLIVIIIVWLPSTLAFLAIF
ncbi:MAG: hypothetical protein ACFFD7_09815 [Candidatus Thorarchaeota archaeon]